MGIWSLTIISKSPVQAFQKLVYVSTLVFGEASKFLLPWKRVFRVTDSQVCSHELLFVFSSVTNILQSRSCMFDRYLLIAFLIVNNTNPVLLF